MGGGGGGFNVKSRICKTHKHLCTVAVNSVDR